MTSEIERSGTSLPTNPEAIIAGLANMQVIAKQSSPDRMGFMKYAQGVYSFGSDDIEVEKGSEWAVNPTAFAHGWIAWGDGVVLGHETASMIEPPIPKASLEEHRYIETDAQSGTETEVVAEWKPWRGIQLVCLSGVDEGEQLLLSNSSMGFNNAFARLVTACVEHMSEDPSTPVPIVLLQSGGYKHKIKTRGFIHTPEFEIIDWENMDATSVAPDDDDEAPEKPEEPEKIDEAQTAENEARKRAVENEARKRAVENEAQEKAEASKTTDKPKRRGRGRGRAKAKDTAEPEKQVRSRRRRGSS